MGVVTNAAKKLLNPGLGGTGVQVATRDLWAIYNNPKTPDSAGMPGAGSLGDDGTVAIVGTDANEIAAPIGTDGVTAISTTTPLGTTTYTSKAFYTQGFARIVGTVFSNSNGNLHVQQSSDGVNWDSDTTVAVTGGTGAPFSVEITAPYARLQYVPTASQATFRLFPFLRRI